MEKKELMLESSLFLYSFSKEMAAKDKVKFLREFFGYRLSQNGKRYAYGGLLKKFSGMKISNNTFLVPKRNTAIIKTYFESRGVEFVVKE